MIDENEILEIKKNISKNIIAINDLRDQVKVMKNNIIKHEETIACSNQSIKDWNALIREQHYIITKHESLLQTEGNLIAIYESYIANMTETNEVIQKMMLNLTVNPQREVIKQKWIKKDKEEKKEKGKHWASREFLPFEEARSYMHEQNLKSHLEWKEWSKTERPQNIPSQPAVKYKDEWISWPYWLGTNKIEPTKRKTLSLFKR